MAGSYEKCYARKRKSDGNYWTCYKRKGHHLRAGRDNQRHVDNKQAPAHYWEWEVQCTSVDCTELVDPYSTQYEPDALQLCDLHYSEYLDSVRYPKDESREKHGAR